MAWLFLGIAIGAEIIATTALKYSQGFSKPGPTIIVVIGYVIAFYTLGQALKTIEVGIAYAIWAGLGTAIVALIGIALLGEAVSPMKIAGIVMVIAGVVALSLGSPH
ncbi:MAG TPA: multidrug efflux SMR transporter [Thermomicrobiales bacterium]|nr:multidrug efflux SMR transporter [Thermomicrobiales bacterium]